MAGCHTLLICAHLCLSVGGTSLPEGSVCSACSVGHSLCLLCWCCRGSCTSVVVFCQNVLCVPRILWELSPRLLGYERGSILPRISRISTEVRLRYWRRGYGRMPYPPNLCLSVGGFLCQKVLCVPRVLWGTLPICFVGAVLALASGKAEQRQLHQRGSILPRISRISTDG